jgi:hypothetical protein
MGLPIGLLPEGGQVLPHFEHIFSRALTLLCPILLWLYFNASVVGGWSVGCRLSVIDQLLVDRPQ